MACAATRWAVTVVAFDGTHLCSKQFRKAVRKAYGCMATEKDPADAYETSDAFVEHCLASHVAANNVMLQRHAVREALKQVELDPAPITTDPNVDDGPAVMDYYFSQYDKTECMLYMREQCAELAARGADAVDALDAESFIRSLSFRPARTDDFDVGIISEDVIVDLHAATSKPTMPCVTVLREVSIDAWMRTASEVQSMASAPDCLDQKASQQVATFFSAAAQKGGHLWTPTRQASLALLSMASHRRNPVLSVLATAVFQFCVNPKLGWQLATQFDAPDAISIRGNGK